MKDMRSEIQTLTRALTTLTNSMVESSSNKQRGGGARGDKGCTMDEDGDSDKENNQHTRDRDGGRHEKKKFGDVEKKKILCGDNQQKELDLQSILQWTED